MSQEPNEFGIGGSSILPAGQSDAKVAPEEVFGGIGTQMPGGTA